ncbi:13980_t:CDS:2, partial [Ambispora leptoticha]
LPNVRSTDNRHICRSDKELWLVEGESIFVDLTNVKQQNNNVQLSEPTSIKNINQRHKEYDDATSTDNEDINITSQVSLSDDESDNDIILPQVSLLVYENNEAILPHSGNDIALPAHRNNNIIGVWRSISDTLSRIYLSLMIFIIWCGYIL